MRLRISTKLVLIFVLLAMFLLVISLPSVNRRVSWQLEVAMAYARGLIDPAGELPAALPQPRVATTRQAPQTPTPATHEPTATPTIGPTPTPTPSPTPIPPVVSLPSPKWEKQDINNCGPASLAMYLRFYGWQGDQFDIQELLKPNRKDRNVNVEELAFYVRNKAGWLNIEYRVGGNIDLLKKLIAAGIPVMVEEGMHLNETSWKNDDHWAAHYLLVTAYDDTARTFTGQDSFYGADRDVSYETLDEFWQQFNRVYILLYRPEQEPLVKSLLGADWDPDANRQHALEISQAETEARPENAFAWFNLGSNLAYFERYIEATDAYDQARAIGLPQRMLRYQFGPFMAYFHTGQMSDLFALTEYALKITPISEEAMLWYGWGLYREGKTGEAIAQWQNALKENPNYEDAQYALNFVSGSH